MSGVLGWNYYQQQGGPMICSWIECSNGKVPHNAVRAGTDHGNQPVYAGRAHHKSDLIPAKVAPAHGCAFVPWDGKEHRKTDYEVLTTNYVVRWVKEAHGRLPPQALPVGRTKEGEQLYMGRVYHNGTLLPGKIHPSHNCLYLPYGDKEHRYTDYEALVITYY